MTLHWSRIGTLLLSKSSLNSWNFFWNFVNTEERAWNNARVWWFELLFRVWQGLKQIEAIFIPRYFIWTAVSCRKGRPLIEGDRVFVTVRYHKFLPWISHIRFRRISRQELLLPRTILLALTFHFLRVALTAAMKENLLLNDVRKFFEINSSVKSRSLKNS